MFIKIFLKLFFFAVTGNRFGLLQVKVGLISILSRYNVRVSKQTPIPLTIDPRTFILSPKGGMHLKFELRSK